MRSGWLKQAGRVLLVLGLAVGPWPSVFAAPVSMPAMHAQSVSTHDQDSDDEHAMAMPCGEHAEAADATPAPDCCHGDAGCSMATCAAMSCGFFSAPSLPVAVLSMRLPSFDRDTAAWTSPARLEPLARERLRPPIA